MEDASAIDMIAEIGASCRMRLNKFANMLNSRRFERFRANHAETRFSVGGPIRIDRWRSSPSIDQRADALRAPGSERARPSRHVGSRITREMQHQTTLCGGGPG